MSNEKTQSKTIASADRRDEENDRSSESARIKKTQHEKRAELHKVLTREIVREARQFAIKQGSATDQEIHEEAQAIEEDARSRSRSIQQIATQPR